MAPFFTSLQALRALLDTGLQNFCSARWSKLPSIKIAFKKRQEVNLADLPCGFITRPQVDVQDDDIGTAQGKHTVLFYFGLIEDDREKAAQYVIEATEEIRSIVRGNRTLDGAVVSLDLNNLANDEGHFHPVYFISAEMSITHRS